MAGINNVLLIGNLGNDPELKVTANGNHLTKFRLATNEKWKDKDGEQQEKTEWHHITVWGRQAETAASYLSKGSQVCIEGRIQTRKYDDREGKERWFTEIVARHVTFLGKRGQSQPSEGETTAPF